MVAGWTHNRADPGKVGWSVLADPGKTNKRWINRPGKAVDHSAGLSEAPRRIYNWLVSSLRHCLTIFVTI